jgi:hypothetical protein
MQIWINTLSFGKITLSVNPLDNIGFVKKMVRQKIVERFEGYDVELMASCENSLIYAGKHLENKLTIADYNIVKDVTLRMVFGLDGGAKRGRVGAGGAAAADAPHNTNGAVIMDMTDFTMEMKLGVEKIKFNIIEWVAGLTVVQHIELKEVMLENQRYIMSDPTIRKYATFVAIFGELEV